LRPYGIWAVYLKIRMFFLPRIFESIRDYLHLMGFSTSPTGNDEEPGILSSTLLQGCRRITSNSVLLAKQLFNVYWMHDLSLSHTEFPRNHLRYIDFYWFSRGGGVASGSSPAFAIRFFYAPPQSVTLYVVVI